MAQQNNEKIIQVEKYAFERGQNHREHQRYITAK
jgi:hypothetical protein